MDDQLGQKQTACAFAQFGALEDVQVKEGGWSEELSAYGKMAEVFEEEHAENAKQMPDEEYWDCVDFYDALNVFWIDHKESYFLCKVNEVAS